MRETNYLSPFLFIRAGENSTTKTMVYTGSIYKGDMNLYGKLNSKDGLQFRGSLVKTHACKKRCYKTKKGMENMTDKT
jgi:hypothetical protein